MKGLNSHSHWELPTNLESSNLSREHLSTEIGRTRLGLHPTTPQPARRVAWRTEQRRFVQPVRAWRNTFGNLIESLRFKEAYSGLRFYRCIDARHTEGAASSNSRFQTVLFQRCSAKLVAGLAPSGARPHLERFGKTKREGMTEGRKKQTKHNSQNNQTTTCNFIPPLALSREIAPARGVGKYSTKLRAGISRGRAGPQSRKIVMMNYGVLLSDQLLE